MIVYPPATDTQCSLIGKEYKIDPKLFDKLDPYESLSVDKEKKSCKKNFNEAIQYSLQLADTVGARVRCPLIGSVHLLESFAMKV